MARLPGTSIADLIVPTDSRARYPTHDDFYGKGGYSIITTGLLTLTSATFESIPFPRQKVGQIVYDQVNDKHYQIRTTGRVLSAPFCMRGAWPYEYDGSFLSTSFRARGGNNIIVSNVGQLLYNGGLFTKDFYENSGILAGKDNKLEVSLQTNNFLQTGTSTVIVGGSGNNIESTSYAFIGGGAGNTIGANVNLFGSIVGGRGNRLNSGLYSFIGGGLSNNVGGTSRGGGNYGIIVGGRNNLNIGTYNIIGGGENNLVRGTYNGILGGKNNQALGQGDIVIGGQTNKTFGASEPGRILFTRNYTDLNITRAYALETNFLRLNNTLVETIPGASVLGVNAAGLAQIYSFTRTYNDHLTGRPVLQTLTSDVPTASGRFGKSAFFAYSKTNVQTGLIVGEPGANKVHIYTFASSDANQLFVRRQTLNLSSFDAFAPSDSQFGFSLHFMDGGFNSVKTPASPYGLLTVGAPGNNSVYVFKCDKVDPFSSIGAYTDYTFLEKLTGDSNSEFGYDVKSVGFWNDGLTQFVSGAYIAVGAPNQITNAGNSGAVRFFRALLSPSYSYSNKQFTNFKYLGEMNNTYGNDANYYQMKPNDRYGQSLQRFEVEIKPIAKFSIEEATQAINSPTALSSYNLATYVNSPNKSLVFIYREDPLLPNKLIDQTFTYNLNYTLDPALITIGYSSALALSAGSYSGKNFFLSGSNEDIPYIETAYGEYSILGQGDVPNLKYEGPNSSVTGVYSIKSILSATNVEWVNQLQKTRSNSNDLGEQYEVIATSNNPKNFNGVTNSTFPGTILASNPAGEDGFTFLFPPYPTSNYNTIQSYGFQNVRIPGTDVLPGFATFYYLSAGVLSYSHAALDFPGETTSSSVMVGGRNNTIRGKDSAIFAGISNTVNTNITRGIIVGGTLNTIEDSTNVGIAKQNSVIVTGVSNKVDSTEYGAILNGNANVINVGANFSTIINGTNNSIGQNSTYSTIINGINSTVQQNLTGVFVVGSSINATQSNTTYVNNLIATNHIQAATKSFSIKHPTKEGKKLTYGSLESPYHGVRLTGLGTIKNNKCIVKLPDYISKLVKRQEINIQLTNYGHNKSIYVDQIDIPNNRFLVRVDGFINKFSQYEFFWTFTAIRKDVPMIEVES